MYIAYIIFNKFKRGISMNFTNISGVYQYIENELQNNKNIGDFDIISPSKTININNKNVKIFNKNNINVFGKTIATKQLFIKTDSTQGMNNNNIFIFPNHPIKKEIDNILQINKKLWDNSPICITTQQKEIYKIILKVFFDYSIPNIKKFG